MKVIRFSVCGLLVLMFLQSVSANNGQLDHLVSQLFSGDTNREQQALTAIEKTQPSQLPAILAKRILDRQKEQRDTALKALRLYPKKKVLDSWLFVLKNTESFILQKMVIDELSDIHDRRLVLPFAAKLRSSYLTVRRSAAVALTKGDDRMYPFILSMAEGKNPVHKIYAIEAMFYLYDMRFYNTLIGLLKDENKSVRIYTIRCIRKNRLDKALYLLRNIALKDTNDEVRINAIQTLGDFKDNKSLYVLHRSIKDSNHSIRIESVKSIQQIGYKKSSYPLSNQLAVEENKEVVDRILDAFISLESIGNSHGLKKVLLTQADVELRIKAAFILGEVFGKNNSTILIEGLKDKDYKVRAEICHALGNYHTRHVIETLLAVIKNDNQRYVRSAALFALKKINNKNVTLPLYDMYSDENDIIFKEMLRRVIREFIQRYM